MSNGVIHSKASKSLALTKHPPYFEMVRDAILTLNERNGSSQYAIGKFIQDKHKDMPVNFKKMLLTQLLASYKLPSAAKTVAAAKLKKGAAPVKKKPTAPAKTKAAKPVAKLARTSTRWIPGKKAPAKVAPKTSGRLITLEEIIKHFGEPMEEAAAILRG